MKITLQRLVFYCFLLATLLTKSPAAELTAAEKEVVMEEITKSLLKRTPYVAEYKAIKPEAEIPVIMGHGKDGQFYLNAVIEQEAMTAMSDGKRMFLLLQGKALCINEFQPLVNSLLILSEIIGNSSACPLSPHFHLNKTSATIGTGTGFVFNSTFLDEDTKVTKRPNGNYEFTCEEYGTVVIDPATASLVEQNVAGRQIKRIRFDKEKAADEIAGLIKKHKPEKFDIIPLDQYQPAALTMLLIIIQHTIQEVDDGERTVESVRDKWSKHEDDLRKKVMPGIFFGESRKQHNKFLDEYHPAIVEEFKKHLKDINMAPDAIERYLKSGAVEDQLKPVLERVMKKAIDESSEERRRQILLNALHGELKATTVAGQQARKDIELALVKAYFSYITDESIARIKRNQDLE